MKADISPIAISIELNDQKLAIVLDENYSDEDLIGNLEMRSHDLRNLVSSITMVFHLFARQQKDGFPVSRELLEKWFMQLQELNALVARSDGDSDRFNQLHTEQIRKGLALGMDSAQIYQSHSDGSHQDGAASMVLVADDSAFKISKALDWTPDFVIGSLSR